MLLRAAVDRSVAAPDVTVSRLQTKLEDWFALRGTRDVYALLKLFSDSSTWKTAPRAALLAPICDILSPRDLANMFLRVAEFQLNTSV